MIDRSHELPVTRQCQVLKLARSTVYYQPRPVSPENLALMRRIDELHLEYPFAGSRMLRDMLRREGHAVGRGRVGRLMKRMGIEALYRRPNTSRRRGADAVYPYLLRNLTVERPNIDIFRRTATASTWLSISCAINFIRDWTKVEVDEERFAQAYPVSLSRT
jgi:putative transposase